MKAATSICFFFGWKGLSFFALGSAHSKRAGPQAVTVQDTDQVTGEEVDFLCPQ